MIYHHLSCSYVLRFSNHLHSKSNIDRTCPPKKHGKIVLHEEIIRCSNSTDLTARPKAPKKTPHTAFVVTISDGSHKVRKENNDKNITPRYTEYQGICAKSIHFWFQTSHMSCFLLIFVVLPKDASSVFTSVGHSKKAKAWRLVKMFDQMLWELGCPPSQ